MQTNNRKTAVFGSSEEEFERWQRWLEKSDDTLLRWLWDYDCGPGGSEVFFEWADEYGSVTLDLCLLKGYEIFENTMDPYDEVGADDYQERLKEYQDLKREILEEHPLLFSLRDEVEELKREFGLEEEA